MKHISAHIRTQGSKREKITERGELMKYFLDNLNKTRMRDGLGPLTMGRMGHALQAIPTQDLYFLKSVCDDAKARGGLDAFSKKFWWEINPKKHTEEKHA